MGGMIDIAWLREHPDTLRVALARRGLEMDLDGLIRLDVERRQVRVEAERARAEQKRLGLRIRELAGDEKASAVAEASDLAARYREGVA
ncbi:MAG: serine--tRNA ligase, partial [Acidimicrobiia bacterium]|nr:serine--tRNA ligase [Acidimicrobiia bacterium]